MDGVGGNCEERFPSVLKSEQTHVPLDLVGILENEGHCSYLCTQLMLFKG